MNIIYFSFARPIRWLIANSDPVSVTLRSRPEWTAINPLASRLPTLPQPSGHRSGTRVLGLINNSALVETSNLAFQVESLGVLGKNAPEGTHDRLSWFLDEEWPSITKAFASKLRFITKQAGIQEGQSIGFAAAQNDLSELRFPEARDRGNTYVSSYDIETAVTWEKFTATDELILDEPLAVHHTLLLDAIYAFFRRGSPKSVTLFGNRNGNIRESGLGRSTRECC